MKRDTSLFSEDFKVETSNQVIDYDTSHIYTGHIYGKYCTLKWIKVQNIVKHGFNSTYAYKCISILLGYLHY